MQAKKATVAPSERRILVAALNARGPRSQWTLACCSARRSPAPSASNPTDLECIDVIARRRTGDCRRPCRCDRALHRRGDRDYRPAGGAPVSPIGKRDPADRRKVDVRLVLVALKRAEAYYGSFGAAMDALAYCYSDAEIALFVDYFSRTRDVVLRQIENVKAMRDIASKAEAAETLRSPLRGAAAASRRLLQLPRA